MLAIGAEAARFEPSAWEFAFRGKALFDLGRVEDARETTEEGLRRYPERADLYYRRAVARVAAGEHDEAVDDLRRAIELFPGIADWVRDEPALEPIRDRL